MKYLIILLFVSTLSADYLYTGNNSCVNSLTPDSDSGWCFVDTASGSSYCESDANMTDFIAGYEYGSSCILKHDLQITGMSAEQWQNLMITLANVFGLVMLASISYFIQRV